MYKTAKTNRFLIDLSSHWGLIDSEGVVSHSSSLHKTVVNRLARASNSRQAFNELAQRLIRLAEHAFSLRDVNALQEVSRILANLPISNVRYVGQYYQALAISRNSQSDEALLLLAMVAENAPLAYRARAIQTLGSIYHRNGRHDEALRLYPEAIRAASPENGRDLLTMVLANLEISCISSEMGDHQGALVTLQHLSPLVYLVAKQSPLYFYFYHNELAVEFAELGRIAEAEAACAIALASPFAHAYPEWSETRDEIAAKRGSATPSVVSINRAPEAPPSPQPEPQSKPKPIGGLAPGWPVQRKHSFQRSIIPIRATATIAFNAVSILDRVLICIGPRAPPALF